MVDTSVQLFNWGSFSLSSGRHSKLKIDCDALTPADLQTCAKLLREILPPFDYAAGVRFGGYPLAEIMQEFTVILRGQARQMLIVDDVFTTGASLCRERDKLRKLFPQAIFSGAVIVARAPTPHWITPLFTLNPHLDIV